MKQTKHKTKDINTQNKKEKTTLHYPLFPKESPAAPPIKAGKSLDTT